MKWMLKLFDFIGRRKESTKPSSRKKEANNIKKVSTNMLWLVGSSTLLITLCFCIYFEEARFAKLFTLLSVIAAYYLSGCAIGFIFAIPKSAQGAKPVAPAESGTESKEADYYDDNTNLEEISDWLVKIIVGLGLTQFNYVRSMIESAAREISTALNYREASPGHFFVFAYAIIVFYSVAGLINGYLWTRIEFRRILIKSRKETEIIQKLKEEKESLQEENQSILTKNKKDQELIGKQKDAIVSMIKDRDPDADNDLTTQTETFISPRIYDLVKSIAKSVPVKDKTDLHKGRWGKSSILGIAELSAEVSASSFPLLYKVKIIVTTLNNEPFGGPVAILLHDSFKPEIHLLDGRDKTEVFVEVLAYEAFTTAALLNIDTAYQSLELDLNDLDNLPEGFYWT